MLESMLNRVLRLQRLVQLAALHNVAGATGYSGKRCCGVRAGKIPLLWCDSPWTGVVRAAGVRFISPSVLSELSGQCIDERKRDAIFNFVAAESVTFS